MVMQEKTDYRTRTWIRYISRSEMAMEDYCGDDELELYITYSQPLQWQSFPEYIKEFRFI
jgi:leucine-rich repeat protein SHOC2